MEEKQYFFLSYAWRYRSVDSFEIANVVIDRSPLEELDSWKEYKEEMKLLFYKEITKEEFEKFDGHFD